MVTFGPVPSRRLGRSLGVNNIPPKFCSLSCSYCQIGKTDTLQIARQPFYEPDYIYNEVLKKVQEAEAQGEPIDYLAFVPDGEPTLDSNLGATIKLLRPLGIKIAVITNSTLLWDESVRADLCNADWVSIKADAVTPAVWRRADRPHKALELPRIMDGMRQFAQEFTGTLVTETMLMHSINDAPEELTAIAAFVKELRPATSCLSIPTRPPAVPTVRIPTEAALAAAYQIFSSTLCTSNSTGSTADAARVSSTNGTPAPPNTTAVECIFGYEGNNFASTGNAAEDLLSITSVHPMREDAVREFLAANNANWNIVEQMVEDERLLKTHYEGNNFYVRKLIKK